MSRPRITMAAAIAIAGLFVVPAFASAEDGATSGGPPKGFDVTDRIAQAGNSDTPVDLFEEVDPVERFPDEGEAGAPIDLSKDPTPTEPTDLFEETNGSFASDAAVEQQLLRCAAGFGCDGTAITETDAQVLTDMTREQAGDAYAETYPDAYLEDAFSEGGAGQSEPNRDDAVDLFDEANPVDRFPAPGDTGEPIDLFKETDPVERFPDEGEAGASIDLSKDGGADEAVDLFDEANPVDRFPDPGDAGEPIDLFKGEGSAPSEEATDTRTSSASEPSVGLPDFAAMEGFATAPCPGAAFEWPDFMHMPGHKVATCQQANNGRFGGCGQPAANLFCLTNGYRRAACFGVGVAARALNAGVYCTGGACSAFSFIVCE